MKLKNFSLVKNAYYVKRQDFLQNYFFENGFLWSKYGAGTWTGGRPGIVTCKKSEPEPKK